MKTPELATKEEANRILDLYHSVLDTPYCRWSMHYPLMENVEDYFTLCVLREI